MKRTLQKTYIPCSCGITTLHHEPLDDTVKDRVVVIPGMIKAKDVIKQGNGNARQCVRLSIENTVVRERERERREREREK